MVIVQLQDTAAEKLLRQARERGMSLETYIESLAELPGRGVSSNGHDGAAWKRKFAAFMDARRAWSDANLPPGHVVDDSRESIYEDRGA